MPKKLRPTAGQPTKYNEDMLEKARHYLENFEKLGDAVPSIVGLACELSVCESTVYNWAAAKGNEKFLGTLELIKNMQHRTALNKGITGEFNSAITKLLLHNHGYSDKVDQTLSAPSGGPVQIIELVAPIPKQQETQQETQ